MLSPETLFAIALTVAAMLVPAELWWVRGLLWLLLSGIVVHLLVVGWRPYFDDKRARVGAWIGATLFSLFIGWQSTWIPMMQARHPIAVTPNEIEFHDLDKDMQETYALTIENTTNDNLYDVELYITGRRVDDPRLENALDPSSFVVNETPEYRHSILDTNVGDLATTGCYDFEGYPVVLVVIDEVRAKERREITVTSKRASARLSAEIEGYRYKPAPVLRANDGSFRMCFAAARILFYCRRTMTIIGSGGSMNCDLDTSDTKTAEICKIVNR